MRHGVLVSLVLACSSRAPEPPLRPLTGGASPVRCTPETCATACDEQIAALRDPPAGYLPSFEGGRCVSATFLEVISPTGPSGAPPPPPGVEAPMAHQAREFKRPRCECLSADGHPENNWILGTQISGNSCLVPDRLGQCLLDLSEAPTCTPNVDDGVCTTLCRRIEALVRDSAVRRYDAQVHGFQCLPSNRCACIARVNDRCYDPGQAVAVRPWTVPFPYDCALPASEIIRRSGTDCADGCAPGQVCLFGGCAPPPDGPCARGGCPAGFSCHENMDLDACSGCSPSACIPTPVCETLSADCR
jgi:hypothetical protein